MKKKEKNKEKYDGYTVNNNKNKAGHALTMSIDTDNAKTSNKNNQKTKMTKNILMELKKTLMIIFPKKISLLKTFSCYTENKSANLEPNQTGINK